jgi:spore coat protein H
VACGVVAIVLVKARTRQEQVIIFPGQPQQSQLRVLPGVQSFHQQPRVVSEEKLAGCPLPIYELRLAPGDLRAIEMAAFGNTEYPATFTAAGKDYTGVKVRPRGAWSRGWPKKSLKIHFSHEAPFQGHHSLNLNSAWRDPAFVREVLAYEVFASCDVPASQARMIRLQVNGQFYGLYVEVEQPDKALLARHHLESADLYKAASNSRDADERRLGDEASYRQAYTRETRKTADFGDLAAFCQALASESDAAAFFKQHVAVEEYINYLAANVLIQNWDGFNKNHYVACDRGEPAKWHVIPWDLDRTFGDHWHMRFDEARLPILLGTRAQPGVTGWNRLEDRFFSEPELRARFLDRLAELLAKEFTTEKLFPRLDKLQTEIAVAAEADRARWPSPAGDLHDGIQGVKAFIEQRRVYLLQEIPRLRKSGRF